MQNETLLENNFSQALKGFAESNATDSAARMKLLKAYAQLIDSLSYDDSQTREHKLLFLFSSPVEQLDLTQTGEIARTLYLYTFREFLDTYAAEPVIQTAIQQAIDNPLLSLSVRTALASEYRI